MKKQIEEVKEIWEKCSFECNGSRNMTRIGFLQAVQELGMQIEEEPEEDEGMVMVKRDSEGNTVIYPVEAKSACK